LKYIKKIRDYYYQLHLNAYVKAHSTQLKNINSLKNIPKTVLIISNTALGDTLLSLSAIKSFKQSFPDTKIVFLVNQNLVPLFHNYPYIDKIIPFYGGYKKYFETINKIKKQKPEMSIIFHGNGPQDIQISILSGVNFILKHPTNSTLKGYLSFDFNQKYQHTIEDRLDILRKLNAKKIYLKPELPNINNKNIDDKIDKYIGTDNIIIGFQVGAADIYKMWPIENFIKLAKMLIAYKKDITIILTGIQKEYALAERISSIFNNNIINSCGKFSIEELPYLIKKMDLLVTNDTGTMHLAIALDTPTISLFATTNSDISGPHPSLLEKHSIIQKNGLEVQSLPKKQRTNELMKLISVKEVFSKIKEKISHD